LLLAAATRSAQALVAAEKAFTVEIKETIMKTHTKSTVARGGQAPFGTAADLVDQLAKFAELRAAGTLTEEEFTELKRNLIERLPEKTSQNDHIKQLSYYE
jgi:hypothetical protein